MRGLRLLHTEASCGWGGQELRVLAETQGMLRRGHEVMVAAAPESRIYAEASRRGIACLALPIARRGVAGVMSLRSLITERDIELVNTHSSSDAWLAAMALLAMRGAPPMVRTRHISAPIPGNAMTRWLYARATAHIVTTGEALRLQVIREARVAPGRVTSVPTGVDLSVFQPGDRGAARATLGLLGLREGFLVVIVATLRSWKGHSDLLEAIAASPGMQLAIVGDGPGRDNLRRQAATLGIEDRVVFAGQQEQVVPWIQAADAVALPSYANEGVPQALMQAMACGLPVVTTGVGAIGEIVSHEVHGLVVPPRDPRALGEALVRLMQEPELRARLGAAGLAQAAQKFSLERMLDGMESVFESVLRANRAEARAA